MPDAIIAISTFVLPVVAMFVYIFFIKRILLSRFWLIFLTIFLMISVYIMIIYISYFIPEKLTFTQRIFYFTFLYLFCFTMFFSNLLEGFKIAYYPNSKPHENLWKDCSDIVGYYENPKKATIVAHIYRKVLFSGYFLFLLMFAARAYYDTGMQNQVVMFITAIVAVDGILFFCCMSFFRLLVKCPNCETPVFYIDQNLGAFFIIAKRVIKERILDCVYCKATYALDPKLDLDELRAKKKVMLAEKKNPDELYP